jgi:hypothetical protein
MQSTKDRLKRQAEDLAKKSSKLVARSQSFKDSFRQFSILQERMADLTMPYDEEGKSARRDTVLAAKKSGNIPRAKMLAARYTSEEFAVDTVISEIKAIVGNK